LNFLKKFSDGEYKCHFDYMYQTLTLSLNRMEFGWILGFNYGTYFLQDEFWILSSTSDKFWSSTMEHVFYKTLFIIQPDFESPLLLLLRTRGFIKKTKRMLNKFVSRFAKWFTDFRKYLHNQIIL